MASDLLDRGEVRDDPGDAQKWLRRAEVDGGQRPGITSEEDGRGTSPRATWGCSALRQARIFDRAVRRRSIPAV